MDTAPLSPSASVLADAVGALLSARSAIDHALRCLQPSPAEGLPSRCPVYRGLACRLEGQPHGKHEAIVHGEVFTWDDAAAADEKHHPDVDRAGAGARASAIAAGHSVLCATTGNDLDCTGPDGDATEEMALVKAWWAAERREEVRLRTVQDPWSPGESDDTAPKSPRRFVEPAEDMPPQIVVAPPSIWFGTTFYHATTGADPWRVIAVGPGTDDAHCLQYEGEASDIFPLPDRYASTESLTDPDGQWRREPWPKPPSMSNGAAGTIWSSKGGARYVEIARMHNEALEMVEVRLESGGTTDWWTVEELAELGIEKTPEHPGAEAWRASCREIAGDDGGIDGYDRAPVEPVPGCASAGTDLDARRDEAVERGDRGVDVDGHGSGAEAIGPRGRYLDAVKDSAQQLGRSLTAAEGFVAMFDGAIIDGQPIRTMQSVIAGASTPDMPAGAASRSRLLDAEQGWPISAAMAASDPPPSTDPRDYPASDPLCACGNPECAPEATVGEPHDYATHPDSPPDGAAFVLAGSAPLAPIYVVAAHPVDAWTPGDSTVAVLAKMGFGEAESAQHIDAFREHIKSTRPDTQRFGKPFVAFIKARIAATPKAEESAVQAVAGEA